MKPWREAPPSRMTPWQLGCMELARCDVANSGRGTVGVCERVACGHGDGAHHWVYAPDPEEGERKTFTLYGPRRRHV